MAHTLLFSTSDRKPCVVALGLKQLFVEFIDCVLTFIHAASPAVTILSDYFIFLYFDRWAAAAAEVEFANFLLIFPKSLLRCHEDCGHLWVISLLYLDHNTQIISMATEQPPAIDEGHEMWLKAT